MGDETEGRAAAFPPVFVRSPLSSPLSLRITCFSQTSRLPSVTVQPGAGLRNVISSGEKESADSDSDRAEQSGEGVFCNPTASQTHTERLLSHLGVTWPPILPEGRQRLG